MPETKKPTQTEKRLRDLERKVDFIYNAIVKQATEQLQQQVGVNLEQTVREQLEGALNGPSTGNDSAQG